MSQAAFADEESPDQAGRRAALHGTIHSQPALMILERAPFPTSPDYLTSISTSLRTLRSMVRALQG